MSIAAAGRMAEGPRWWVPGDWNGFFGLFTNVLLNVIVLTGLCLGVVVKERHDVATRREELLDDDNGVLGLAVAEVTGDRLLGHRKRLSILLGATRFSFSL